MNEPDFFSAVIRLRLSPPGFFEREDSSSSKLFRTGCEGKLKEFHHGSKVIVVNGDARGVYSLRVVCRRKGLRLED